jgi:hypothetical protein
MLPVLQRGAVFGPVGTVSPPGAHRRLQEVPASTSRSPRREQKKLSRKGTDTEREVRQEVRHNSSVPCSSTGSNPTG